MSVQSVKDFFKHKDRDIEIMLFDDTSTVHKAAESLGVSAGEIAKSLLFQVKNQFVMVVIAGDQRLDNRKFKDNFQTKAKMPDFQLVEEVTGHPVGGVCPFGLRRDIPVYLDLSLQAYERIYPAAGAPNAAVSLSVQELVELTGGKWVDLAQTS